MNPLSLFRFLTLLILSVTLQPAFAGVQTPKVIPSLYVVEKLIYSYHVNADATSEIIEEQQVLVKDQIVVDGLATEDISFNSTQKKVEILEAYTILPSGEKLNVEPKAIRLVDAENGGGTASFSDVKKSMQWHSFLSRIGTQGQFQ